MSEDDLDQLPPHFHREVRCLRRAGVGSWQDLAGLADERLRRLAAAGDASEPRLVRLRAQARLVSELDLPPAEAALLLHAGIASRRGLAEADPDRLLLQIGRLQRQLAGTALPRLDGSTVRGWIRRARRSPN